MTEIVLGQDQKHVPGHYLSERTPRQNAALNTLNYCQNLFAAIFAWKHAYQICYGFFAGTELVPSCTLSQLLNSSKNYLDTCIMLFFLQKTEPIDLAVWN